MNWLSSVSQSVKSRMNGNRSNLIQLKLQETRRQKTDKKNGEMKTKKKRVDKKKEEAY